MTPIETEHFSDECERIRDPAPQSSTEYSISPEILCGPLFLLPTQEAATFTQRLLFIFENIM